jgi:ABC-2 type transport system ATP-binding protein
MRSVSTEARIAQLPGSRAGVDGGAIVLEGLRRSFGHERVLHDVSLRVASGQIVALIGPNGSGKTTLLRILAGVLEPDAGSVAVAGQRPGRGLAGYVPAGDRMLNWRLTGRENLRFFGRIGGVRRNDVPSAILAAAHSADASDLLDKRVGACSTGQRRRLMLAVALLASPPVLLIDEPFSDLDDQGCSAVETASRRWAGGGGLVLYAAPKRSEGPRADLVYRLAHSGIREDA